jgi:hippurate hydrolase
LAAAQCPERPRFAPPTGALVFLGNGTAPDGTVHNVHTPHYDFNDEAIGAGVAFWVRLVRQQLSTQAVPGGQ